METTTGAARRYAREYYHRNRDKVLAKQKLRPKSPRPVFLRLFASARARAAERGLPFDLSPDDITVPEVCPVLGIPLSVNLGHRGSWANSPTLDRLVPSKGYVKGNVVVMSARANFIKQDAGSAEVLKVGQWLQSQGL